MGKKVVNINDHFTLILNALKEEDRVLKKAFSRHNYDPSDETGKGINDLYEHHIQYVLFKQFLKKSNLLVYIEDPYKKKKWKCDLTLYDHNFGKSLWIEIKVTGWCYDWQYKKWIRRDIKKLSRIGGQGIKKYLLVTSIEEETPVIKEWKRWFKKELQGVRFNPRLFNYFETQFSDGERFTAGYYAVCLLEVI